LALILIVGGSAEDGRWLEDALRATGLPISVRSLESVLGARDQADSPGLVPAVVVLHERRRREDLLDALERLRAHPTLGAVPLVVVDHERDIERFTTAVSRGAAACVSPPFDPAHLRATVVRLARWRDTPASRGERRLRRRRPLLLRVDLNLPSEGGVLSGLLRDVSSSGCRVEAPQPVPPGTAVGITPYGYDASLEFRVAAVVRRHVELERGLHMLACRFSGTGAVMAPRLFGVTGGAAAAAAAHS
jgi:CheY-like chemotaxis protein